MSLRRHRTSEEVRQREARWNESHAGVTSDTNAHLPRACRAYFGAPRELDYDGVLMPALPSSVLISQNDRSGFMRKTKTYDARYKISRPATSSLKSRGIFQRQSSLSPKLKSTPRPATAF